MARGTVMLIEDDPLNAFVLQDIVSELGYEVVGVVGSLSWAIEFVATKADTIDAAIVDINLNGIMSYPAAEALVERSVPVIFVTGYRATAIAPSSLAHITVVQKPYSSAQIAQALGCVFDHN